MAALSRGCLRLLNVKIQQSRLTPDTTDLFFVVNEVQRYLVDPDFRPHTGLEPNEKSSNVYDITITDEENRMKCLLNPCLNDLVQSNYLHAGSVIKFQPSQCRIHHNDLNLDSVPFVILDLVEVLDDYDGDAIDPELCCFCGKQEGQNIPLVCSRGSYLPLWNNEDPSGLPWKQIEQTTNKTKYSKPTVTISDLSSNWKRIEFVQKQLIVRVINKVRLRMYGKKDKREKWPFQLYLVVADQTGMCNVVIWGSLCTDFLYGIHEGSVLAIRSFKVRRRYQYMSQPMFRIDLPLYDIEISLDKSNPPAEVAVLSHDIVLSQWNLPSLCGRYVNRKQLSSLPDQFNCDIVGIVLHVGRYYRIRKEAVDQFWCYRWLHLVDPSSPEPITVQLFSTSQPDIQKCILPHSVIVLTQMRVIHDLQNITNSRQKRKLYVTTSNESQVTIIKEGVTNPWFNDDAVKTVSEWRKTESCQQLLLEKASFGGYENYSILPGDLEAYKQRKDDKAMELLCATALCDKLASMCYREAIQINIQGILLGVQYKSDGGMLETSVREEDMEDEETPVVLRLRSGRAVVRKVTEKRKHPSATKTGSSKEMSLSYATWESLTQRATNCGQRFIHPSALRRVYSLQDGADVYMEHIAMPSGSYKTATASNSGHELSDIPIQSPQDYLTFMIAGLNFDVSIIAHFLLPENIPPDVTLTQVLNGQSEVFICSSNLNVDRSEAVNNLLTTADNLRDKRMLFVLDAYRHHNCEELIINRSYLIDQ